MKVIFKLFIFVLLNILVLTPALAGSFSDSFKSWVLDERANVPMSKAESVNLDTASAECMQCHNGSNSSHIVVKSASSVMQFTVSGRQSNHPIGMRYDEYAASDPNSYRARGLLDPNINFVNGRVMCVSCHEQKNNRESALFGYDSYSTLSTASLVSVSTRAACTVKKKLTVGPKISDLCMSCHTV